MSVRNQLTNYELEEFFRYLQDLLVLSLNPRLSFDSAEFLSRRLDCFEKAFCHQDYAFRIGPKYNYFLPSTLSYLLSVNKGNISRTYLISLCTRRRKNNFQPPEWVRSGVPGLPRLDISEDLLEVLRNGAGFRWAADSSSSSACKAKLNKIGPRNVAFVD